MSDCNACTTTMPGEQPDQEPMPTPEPMAPQPAPEQPMPPAPVPAEEPPMELPETPDEVPPPAVEPPAEEMPAEPSFEEAPAEPTAPAEEMLEEPAAPSEPSKPADDMEDLFKDNDSTDKKDETPEPDKKGDDVEDLFKDTNDSGKSAATEPTAEEPMPSETGSDKAIDELFSEPAEETGKSVDVQSQPAVTPTAVQSVFAKVSAQPQRAAADTMRVWTDNTGKYEVTARLVVVGTKHVRLLKETGKYTTVSYDRLSKTDLEFVRDHADAVVANF